MDIVKFGNDGLMDHRVWSTFGVSVKEVDSPIGQFGTGLKYAIAVLMRENRTFKIVSGDEEYVFGVQDTDIRGKNFSQVTCNGERLPFTTHLSSKWKLWQAYRELYSNCLDENGGLDYAGDTVIHAEIGDINHYDVFLDRDRKPIAESAFSEIISGQSKCIYYKGIRAYELSTPSMFTHNLKEADLTEDRTLKYEWDIHKGISEAVLISENVDFVYDFLLQTKGYYEENTSFNHATASPSKAVIDTVTQYRRESVYMQSSLKDKAINILGCLAYDVIDMDDRQKMVIAKASDFCQKIGYKIIFPILLATNLGRETLAVADRKTNQIYLSDTVLTQGVKQVASTLIEENLHLGKGLDDCTYKMQSYLFDQIITMGERLTGEVI